MGRTRTIARRSFLIGSAAVLGGVAFGTYLAVKPSENPLTESLAEGEAAFNPFVKITEQGITLIAPHADSGQGVHSMQTALIAEELDIALDQAEVSFGAPDPAYYNTAMANDAVPFAAFDEGLAARSMRVVASSAFKILGVQGTGGSSSTPDQYDKLRAAGAMARETLKAAAARRTGLPAEQLKTENGRVITPTGEAIPYTALAAEAAQIPPVTDTPLRDPAEWRLIGKPMQRTDIVAKSTGTLPYGIDISLPDMLHAAVRINPRQGGELLDFDAAKAEAMRGVKAVLPVTGGLAVVADNTWRAFKAAEALEVTWGPAPYPAEQAEHWEAVANSFTPERLNTTWRDDGDVDTAHQGEVITAEYRAPYVAHQPLEPLGAIIRADANGAEVWSGHQLPRFVQMQVAAKVGCEMEQVTFHNQFIGGSFGHRLEFDVITLAAEIAAQLPGVPIKLTFSREEDFAQDYPRQIGMARSTGSVKDGRVESWALDIATVSSSVSQMGRMGLSLSGPDAQIVAGAWNMPFALPHLRVRGYIVPELAPTSSWRSVGASTSGFFAEGFFDELIHAAGADPLEERLRLVTRPVHRQVLEAIGEMSNWGSDLGAGRGRGLAMFESFGVPVAEVVEVTDTPAGIRIDKVFVAADVGRVVDPVNFENLVQGGVIWGLGHAINSEITYADGKAEQSNYHMAEGMRLYQTPQIEVRGLENGSHVRGIGEPPVPPAAPALANAIFAATGTRLREMPFYKHINFV
ncbi:xanthine dehydrogenase family protein molybdopterin-binding subunit [Alphaproteobacteria bacterium KMM 3653]|uniref:Xanthine dehydrogenase family protein molybdopterin-binding subunit n=1 Tax=Harenicola maris TaxID=2841044 RepID=A0AAP2CQK8_9RHOB|nr:xanthine dehydrogenase family protein molybdopterin-binding subunit [Harenicola maris]